MGISSLKESVRVKNTLLILPAVQVCEDTFRTGTMKDVVTDGGFDIPDTWKDGD